MKKVNVGGSVTFGGEALAVIAGTCVIEDADMCREVAATMKEACAALGVGYVFKASFDKANRTSVGSFRGPGLNAGLQILSDIREQFDVPVLTDVHEAWQVEPVTEVVDIVQVPAFLCRQTDLLVACGQSERVVNIKKGQFVAPHDMVNAVRKVESTGNTRILLSERGASFGYNQLIVDMTSIPVMQRTGCPVVFDATHSVQRPGGQGTASGGDREFVPTLALAALAAGADALFLEVHPDPDSARSDSASQLALRDAPDLLQRALRVFQAVR